MFRGGNMNHILNYFCKLSQAQLKNKIETIDKERKLLTLENGHRVQCDKPYGHHRGEKVCQGKTTMFGNGN